MISNSNLAALNVMITSNVTQVNGQLTALQRTLQTIRGQGGTLLPNMNNLVSQLSSVNTGTQSITQNFGNMGRIGGMGINNLTHLWSVYGQSSQQTISASFGYFRTGIGVAGIEFRQFISSSISNLSILRTTMANSFRSMINPFNNPRININQMIPNNPATPAFVNMFSSLRQGFSALGQGVIALGPVMSAAFGIGVVAAGALIIKLGELTYKFLEAGMKYNAMMEQMRTGYNVILQGANNPKGYGEQQSKALMKNMKDFANATPFTMPQIAKGADMLLGYGVGEGSINQVEKVTAAVQMLGDVSRGIPEKYNDISYAFGQVTAMGRLQGQELRQMVNAGWNPLLEMSKRTGKTVGELKSDMEDGSISIDMVTQALIDATSEGGRFNKMMEEQAKTGIGKWSTITDKAQMLMGGATEKFFEGVKPLLDDIINLLDAFMSRIDIIGQSIATNLVPPLQDAFKQLLQLVGLTNNGAQGFDNITTAVDNWTLSLGNGIRALMKIVNIVAIFVGTFAAGLGTIGIAFTTLWNGAAIGVQSLVLFIVGLFEWAWKESYNKFVDLFGNKITDYVKLFALVIPGGSGSILSSILPELDKYENTTATWGFLRAMNDASKKRWTDQMEFLTTSTELAINTVNNAFNNLFGNDTAAEDFLKRIRPDPNKPLYTPVDVNSLLGSPASTKDAKDNVKKLADSILDLTNKIVNMGNVFEKVTYEKFSPNKLMMRLSRFTKEMTSWITNLNKLSIQGVPSSMIDELRGMGIQGMGITKALSRASDEQRKQIISTFGNLKTQGMGIAIQTTLSDKIREAKTNEVVIQVTGNNISSEADAEKLAIIIAKKLKDRGVY